MLFFPYGLHILFTLLSRFLHNRCIKWILQSSPAVLSELRAKNGQGREKMNKSTEFPAEHRGWRLSGPAVLVGLLLLTLSACAPTTRIPVETVPVEVPPSFSRQGSQPASQQWWRDLGDPGLHRLIDKALRDNKSLLAAGERLIQAEAVARKAGADLFPGLDGSGSFTSATTRKDGGTTSRSTFLLGLAASYEIDLWGRIHASREAALFDAQVSQEDLQTAALSLAGQIANLWYRLAAGHSQLELLRQQQEANRTGLELIQLRFSAGRTGIADVLQQQQLIESKNGEEARQRALIKVIEHQLAILSGIAPERLEIPDKPILIELPPLPATGVPLDLLARRPDVHSRYLALLAADRRVAAAIAEQYPRLSLSATLNSSASGIGDLFDNWLASLAANIVGPLVDGGARQAEVDRTSAVARERLHAYGQTVLAAIGEVEDALVQENQQRLLLTSLELQLDLATRTLANLRERYKQGAEDYQRILSAFLSQQGLQRALVSGRQELIAFRIDLYRALGGRLPLQELIERGQQPAADQRHPRTHP
jgi:NodT family efflux transporter outer membrane factor (OMF) lipoprotein